MAATRKTATRRPTVRKSTVTKKPAVRKKLATRKAKARAPSPSVGGSALRLAGVGSEAVLKATGPPGTSG